MPGSETRKSSLCEEIWSAVVASPRPNFDRLEFPDDISENEIVEWLENQNEEKSVFVRNLSDRDDELLEEIGFSSKDILRLAEYSPVLTNPVAQRAFELPLGSRVIQAEREAAFHRTMLNSREYRETCPLTGQLISATAGYWINSREFAYLFHGDQPFFVFLTTLAFRRSMFYFPKIRLRIVLTTFGNNPEQCVQDLKHLFVRRWKKISENLNKSKKFFAVHANFVGNIAHSIMDDMSSVRDIIESGNLGKVDRFVLGTKKIFGDFQENFPEIPESKIVQILDNGNTPEIQDLYVDQNYFPIPAYSTYLTRRHVDRVAQVMLSNCSESALHQIQGVEHQHYPIIWFTVRTRARSWRGQETGIVNIIEDLARTYPKLAVVFDGVNEGADESVILEEKAVVKSITDAVQVKGIGLFDTIGATMSENIAWALSAHAYVAPHGAGLAKCHWIANKPGVVHSNNHVVDRFVGHWFDGTDIENANVPVYVTPTSVRTLEGSGEQFRGNTNDRRTDLDQYECDWRVIGHLLKLLLKRVDYNLHAAGQGETRPVAAKIERTEFLPPGQAAASMLQHDQRCSYGYYVSRKACQSGVHLGAKVLVFVPGRVQTGPPHRLIKFADEIGAIVFYPYFPADLTGEYDANAFCYLSASGLRFDLLLLKMLEEFGLRFCVDVSTFYMCGGSGGAQFISRFALLHPDRVSGASVIAPGTITRVTSGRRWWAGVEDCQSRFGITPDLAKIAAIPMQIVVGENDLSLEDGLSGKHWIDEAYDMGANRLERAKNLADDLTSFGSSVELTIVPDAAHELFKLWEPSIEFLTKIMGPADARAQ